ncbi:hypothetical protein [Nocardiopsis potens]|nr:hypothetical protein [Nocardiopsis potens]
MGEGEPEEDPVHDMTDAVASICTRLHGRRARDRAVKALAAAENVE